MIWPNDGLRLAYTKLKTRRIRLAITVTIASILFVAIAGVMFVVRGVVGSLESYSKAGLGSRFIVGANQANYTDFYSNKEIIARTKELEKDLFARKTAEAKRLGIDYDSKSDISAITTFDTPDGKQESLNIVMPVAQQAIGEYLASHPEPGMTELQSQGASYQASGYYDSKGISTLDGFTYLQVLKEGKEDFKGTNQSDGNPTNLKNFSLGWQNMSKALLAPFILPGQTAVVGDDGLIPIFAPYSSLESLLGVKSLPNSATAKQKLAHVEELRKKAAGYQFNVCYRNTISSSQLSQAISQQDELLRNKSNKDYTKPELIYDLPASACGEIRIARDVRDADTKKLDAKQVTFRQTFGEPGPQARTLRFKIVGIVPDSGDGSASSVEQILQSILASSVGNGWYTPKEVVESDEFLKQLFTSPPGSFGQRSMYVELPSADAARKFMETFSCNPDFGAISAQVGNSGFNPFEKCVAQKKYFMLNPFGSNSLAIDQFKIIFAKYFRIVLLVITIIASLIMMGIVSRVIGDSRRETAVFRAIGAKRLDIAQIYLTYVALVCALIAAIAISGGVVLGSLLQGKYAGNVKVAATVAFNAPTNNDTFWLYRIAPQDVLVLLGVILAVGALSATLPLLSNLRRNPIRDMRDER